MTLDQFRKEAQPGSCSSCWAATLVRPFHLPVTGMSHLCFTCASTPAVEMVPREMKPILGAISALLDAVKPPKKPKRPKEEPTGPVVRPMTRRKR